jgi:hypothetical protein
MLYVSYSDELDGWYPPDPYEPDDILVCGVCDSPYHTTAHCDIEDDKDYGPNTWGSVKDGIF